MRREGRAIAGGASDPIQGIGLVRDRLREEAGRRLGEVGVLGWQGRFEQGFRGKEGQQTQSRGRLESVRKEVIIHPFKILAVAWEFHFVS